MDADHTTISGTWCTCSDSFVLLNVLYATLVGLDWIGSVTMIYDLSDTCGLTELTTEVMDGMTAVCIRWMNGSNSSNVRCCAFMCGSTCRFFATKVRKTRQGEEETMQFVRRSSVFLSIDQSSLCATYARYHRWFINDYLKNRSITALYQ
jgi:hypothetical protein